MTDEEVYNEYKESFCERESNESSNKCIQERKEELNWLETRGK
jgi:hypothetical protein